MPSRILAFVAVLAAVLCGCAALDNGLALTPPMGWNSWNYFACNINETDILNMASAMQKNGMQAAGYEYVNIDDCWAVGRYPNGTVIVDPEAFPHGMAWLADQVHEMGFKFGIYTCAGNMTCQQRPGSRGYECIDASTYAEWGVDYVKEDWCYSTGLEPESAYTTMSTCLNATGRPILFSLCDWGRGRPWEWGASVGNMWRTTQDIKDLWISMLWNYDRTKEHVQYQGIGGWNDPDMLEVGNGGMSTVEYRTHFSLWAMLAAPLIAGNNLADMDTDTTDILTAKEVIAVDQDPLGLPMQILMWNRLKGQEILARPLSSPAGSEEYAVVLFNRERHEQQMSIEWGMIDPKFQNATACVVDLWNPGSSQCGVSSVSVNVEAHGVYMIRTSFSV